MMPDIRIQPLSPEELAADEDWWRLYQASFPIYERDPPVVIIRSLETGVGAALRAVLDGHTIGLAVLHRLASPPAVFLVYLAVDPAHQRHGLGSRLLDECWEQGSRDYHDRSAVGMVWEVDPVEGEESAAAAATRREVIEFYERRGGVLIEAVYFQPAPRPWKPVPMRLMYRGAPGARTSPEIGDLIRAIYFEKYEAVNGYMREDLEELLVRSGVGRDD